MKKDIYYWYTPERPEQRRLKKIGRIWFAYVFVNEAHDINNLFIKNLMILAGNRISIWFITGTLLFNVAEKLVGFVKCWDAFAIAKQMCKPLNPNLIRIIGICYNKVFSSKVTMDVDKKDMNNLINLANHYMKLKAWGIIEIPLIFEIQPKGNTKFQGKKILKFLFPILKTKWMDFLSKSLSNRYRINYCEDLEKLENMKEIPLVNQAKPNMKDFLPHLDLMRMSHIYASILCLLEILAC